MQKTEKPTVVQNGAICFAKYKLANRAWMSTLGLYNLPIFDERPEAKEICHKISYFALYRQEKSLSTGTYKIYRATFKKEVTRKELLALNYPGTGKAHANNYFLFEIAPVDCGNAKDFLQKDLAGTAQIVYLRDFSKGNVKEFAKKIEAKDEKALEKLQKCVPYLVPESPLLCVAEAYQMAFWDIDDGEKFEIPGYEIPFPPPKNPKFTFIDLFAGIGGFRIALQNLGGKCVFSSEWDEDAQKTYEANFGEVPYGDITLEETKSAIPDNFDILCAGFPCQAFSIAGDQKGFEDTRGTLFFDVAEIIKRKRPKAIFLENVSNLAAHDNGNTLRVILATLKSLNYDVHYKVLNALDFGVPQNRRRIMIVGFRTTVNFTFPSSVPESAKKTLAEVLEINVDKKYFVNDAIRDSRLARLKDKNFPKPYISHENMAGSITPHHYSSALRAGASANYILINDMRRPTEREMLRFQGFPEEFRIVVPYSVLRKQAGNSVAVPMIFAVAKNIIDNLNLNERHQTYEKAKIA